MSNVTPCNDLNAGTLLTSQDRFIFKLLAFLPCFVRTPFPYPERDFLNSDLQFKSPGIYSLQPGQRYHAQPGVTVGCL